MYIFEHGALVRFIPTGELLRVIHPSEDGLSVLCEHLPDGTGRHHTADAAPDNLAPA